MFEQDYIMRLIKEMVRAILKLLFGLDTDSPIEELLEEKEDRQAYEALLSMVDDGRICDAENRIYEMTESGDKRNLGVAILFYSYLNDKTDEFLEEHHFSREEIRSGLGEITARYGVDGLSEMFLE